MQVTLNLNDDTLAVVQAYLDEAKFTGTPEEYFESKCDGLLKNIVKDRWEKELRERDKTIEQKVAKITKSK